MTKKLATSLLVLVVGLGIITGAVIAKDQIVQQVQTVKSPPLEAVSGQAGEIITGGLSFRKLAEDTGTVGQAVVIPAGAAAPAEPEQIQFEGPVSAVDLNDGLFDLDLGGSGVTAFHVDSQTSFQGDLSGFKNLSADMKVSIVASRAEDGSWRVVSILNQSPLTSTESNGDQNVPRPELIGLQKYNVGGRVTSVGADSLTIQTQGGTPMTFAITEATMFNSYIGGHDGLEDIEVNFTVAVIYYEGQVVGSYPEAYRVVVSNEGVAFNPYQQGWVDSVGASSFTITTNWGATYTFTVNASTQVQGVGSFSEITVGMRAFVYYKDMGGSLLAKGIRVWP